MADNYFITKSFHRNLDLLRSLTGMNKGEFSRFLGIWNLYRNDVNSIGPKLLKAIEDNFAGVDETWLTSSHESLSSDIIFAPRNPLRGQQFNKSHYQTADNPVINRAAEEMDQYQAKALMLTSRVMTSPHREIGKALMKNLEEFAEAVSTKDELARCKVKLEEQDRKIDDQDKKIREMDIEIKNLKEQVAELLRREPHCNSVTPGDGVPVPEDQAM